MNLRLKTIRWRKPVPSTIETKLLAQARRIADFWRVPGNDLSRSVVTRRPNHGVEARSGLPVARLTGTEMCSRTMSHSPATLR
jgi:hypothetical protein